ncbi:hypothetical protein ACS7SF_23065 (plasmid) [Ralstonia sp. 25C]|uniref:hypothetical protein n=1 Tax=Ralstonia sp. 25C TaxID=3447363 RepID=UPI003F753E5E
MAAPSRPQRATTTRLQPRLSALLGQVRETSRHAIRIAREDAQHGKGDFVDCLARLYDHWICFSRGPQRLIKIASAAEVGALSLQHLQHGEADINVTDDPALRALYWTTARRWKNARRDVMNVESHIAQKPDGNQLNPEQQAGTLRCRCKECTTQLARHRAAHELFAAWTAIAARL